ncbi:MAG: PAP2 family protein [Methanobacterium sp.]|nr:PAP2 family protein [Methanobacterium sp.]
MEKLGDQKFEELFAKFISTITPPPIVSIPVFIIINYVLLGFKNSIFITLICLLFAVFFPILTSLILIKKMNTDLDITDRNKRTSPLILAVFSYIIGFLVLYIFNAPVLTIALMFVYFSNTVLILFINFSWKISIHVMGVAGPIAALIYLFGSPEIIFCIIIPFVMWSRIKLNKHTPYQVLAGAILGLILTWIQLYYIVPLF